MQWPRLAHLFALGNYYIADSTYMDSAMPKPRPLPIEPERIEAVRRFNRFYTRRIGVLEENYLETGLNVTETRALFEVAHGAETATELVRRTGFDAGYLSRLLERVAKGGFIRREADPEDRRQRLITLTPKGRQIYEAFNEASRAGTEAMLKPLEEAAQAELLDAMGRIGALLGAPEDKKARIVLRPHRAGDIGWVVARHGALYDAEFGWNAEFEALVAEIGAAFLKNFDPAKEACWIAELNGRPAGSVFIVKHARGIAKLRLLLVEPWARGHGLGQRLVQESVRFARAKGYRRLRLWTNSVLTAARAIYVGEGFQLIETEPHFSFGHHLVGETWELKL